jgi:hypothetical protein
MAAGQELTESCLLGVEVNVCCLYQSVPFDVERPTNNGEYIRLVWCRLTISHGGVVFNAPLYDKMSWHLDMTSLSDPFPKSSPKAPKYTVAEQHVIFLSQA